MAALGPPARRGRHRPLPPRAINRLTNAIGELDPPEAAHTALLGDDSYRMLQAERRIDRKPGKAWAPYSLSKARRLIDSDPEQAWSVLEQVAPGEHKSPYWLTRREIARALGDREALAAAAQEVRRFSALEWSVLSWRLRGSDATLVLLPERTASGLILEIRSSSATGAAAEILWDGQVVAVQPVRRGQPIELAFAVEPQPHLLEIRTLAGKGLTPALVRLRLCTVD